MPSCPYSFSRFPLNVVTHFPPFPFSSAYLGHGPGIYQEGSEEG